MGENIHSEPKLSGKLNLLPFKGFTGSDWIVDQVRRFADVTNGPRIEIVTRYPTGVEQIETALDQDPTAETQSLSIKTLSEHGASTVQACTKNMQGISAAAENALLEKHAAEYDWDTDYLKSASNHETFSQDLRSFVSDAMRYPDLNGADDPVICDLIAFTQSFYEFLIQQGYIPREATVRMAVEHFRQHGITDTSQPDGVLAVQFAEFTAIERLYLSYLTQDARFEAVAREQASIFRTQFETGSVQQLTGLEVNKVSNPAQTGAPEAVGEWLALGGSLSLGTNEAVRHLKAGTYEAHIRKIGTAIHQMKSAGVDYNNIAVVFRDSSAPIGESVEILWGMGIPVSSTVAGGLEHDTAIRELYLVVKSLAETDEGDSILDRDEYLRRLQIRLDQPELPEEIPDAVSVLSVILEATGDERLENGLAYWINETQLKHRIADEGDPLQQRLRFDHVDQVLELARFFDQSEVLPGSWTRFQQALEFEADYKASEQVAAELESQEVGVTVDTVGSLPGANFERVFVAGAVDDEYPAGPMLNRLVPVSRTDDIDVYPRALPDTMAAVNRTFSTPEPPTKDPVRAYSQSLNRRILAEASRMATKGLYFVTYEKAPKRMGKQVHPSRYLSAIDNEIDGFSTSSDVTKVKAPEQVALDTIDERYQEAKLDAKTLPNDETLEREFAAVQTILQTTDLSLREAIASRRDWALGEVGNE